MNQSWRQTVQEAVFDAGTFVDQNITKFTQAFDSVVINKVGEFIDTIKGGTVVGINTQEISNMRAAIRSYCETLDAHLDTIESKTDTQIAFKGEYALAVTEFAVAVKKVCKALTSQLLAFSDQLVEVEKAYNAQDVELKGSIDTDASNIASSVTAYEQKYQ